MPYYGETVKEAFEELKRVEPDLVLTHTRDDLHQDHRLACELTWNTFRDHLILEYEVPKWDGDLGRPNLYVPLETTSSSSKLDLVLRHFPTQAGKHWYDVETFRGSDAPPRPRMRLAVSIRRGVLRSEGRALVMNGPTNVHARSRHREATATSARSSPRSWLGRVTTSSGSTPVSTRDATSGAISPPSRRPDATYAT